MSFLTRVIRRGAVRLVGASFAALALSGSAVGAADWPSRPIRVMVGFAPGGATDIIVRLVGQRMEQELGQPVIVENRAGAGGNLSAHTVALAEPDGYTLGMVSTSVMSINPHLYKRTGFDPKRDFTPISVVVTIPNLLTVNPSIPVKTIAELGEYLRNHQGNVNCASSGAGTTQHIGLVMLLRGFDTSCVIVQHRGNAPAGLEVIAGRMAFHIDSITTGLEQARAGQVRAIAVTSPNRTSIAPDIAAVAETIPGFDAATWAGIVGPKGLPKPIVARVEAAVAAALRDTGVAKRLREIGTEPVGLGPAAFAEMLKSEDARWAPIVTGLDLSLD